MKMRGITIRIIMTAVLMALLTGCSVNEEGIMGGFPYLEIEIATKSVSKVGSSDVIAVKSNRPMTVEVSAGVSWLRANVSGEQLVLEWDDNELEFTREAVVTVSTSNNLVSKDVTVVQDASGEVTIMGDLILHSKAEIASNTYTKTTDNLIIGNVTSIETKSASGEVHTVFDGRKLTASPTDISDVDLSLLEEQIHMVGEKGLAVINTNATTLPCGLIAANGIERVNFEYNSMTVLNSAEQLSALGLKELSLKGNKVADISSLSGCTAMEYLDLTGNEVSDLEPLKSMTGLKKIVLTDLPLTYALLDVFRDLYSVEIVADSVRAEDSPLPVFGDMEITEVSDKEVQLKVKITGNATGLGKTGFYIGRSRNIKEMKYHDAAVSNGILTLTYNPETLYNRIYYVRAYAENAKGAGYSDSDSFGSVVSEEDVYIGSEDDIAQLQAKGYSHVNASVIVGDRTGSNNDGVHLNDGKYDIYFKEHSFADLSFFSQFANIRDGLYIGNAGLASLDVISHIKGIQTLWLKGNRISSMPVMKSYETLKSLDVSMNNISDFAFLANMPVLERLYLGSSEAPDKETNEIGVLTGLDKYKNLKYIDLSGLPIHEWQVEDLRALMPETEIVFVSGGRDPFIPTVASTGLNRLDGAVVMKGVVSGNGGTPVTEYGFYFGKDKAALKKIKVGSSIEKGAEFNYEVAVPDEDKYYFYPYALNSYGESKAPMIEFSISSSDLCQNGTSNCYIVTHSGEYFFDATVIGNGSAGIMNGFHTSSPDITPQSAIVLWQDGDKDIVKDVKLENGQVHFVATGVEGNALVAVKNTAGRIIWSWHIWATDQPKNHIYTNSNGTFVVLDRNIGAIRADRGAGDVWKESIGTVYFWGRKDPFISEDTYSKGNTSLTIDESIASPTLSHSTNIWTAGRSSWATTPNTSFWSDSQKTIYDPCPVGYRVATANVWTGFTATNTTSSNINEFNIKGGYDHGFHFYINSEKTETAWYPMTHHLDWHGDYIDVASEARYWTSTYTKDTDKQFWGFNYNSDADTKVMMTDKNSDGHAYSVRCMSEDTPACIVYTDNVVKASETSLNATGNVVMIESSQISEKGFVWSTNTMLPSYKLNEGKVVADNANPGKFSCTINIADSSSKCYIRAYAIVDGVTSYGNVIEYTPESCGSGEGFTGDDFEL